MKTKAGQKALAEAAGKGQLDVVRILVEHGVDVKTETGQKALAEAAGNGQWDLVRFLAEKWVDLHTEAGRYACTVASQTKMWKVMKVLADHGVDPDAVYAKLTSAALAQDWNPFSVFTDSYTLVEVIKRCSLALVQMEQDLLSGHVRWQYEHRRGWTDMGVEANAILEKTYLVGDPLSWATTYTVQNNQKQRKPIRKTNQKQPTPLDKTNTPIAFGA